MSSIDKSFAFVNVCVEERCFRVGYFSRELDSRMVAVCLFNEFPGELRVFVFVYIPDRGYIVNIPSFSILGCNNLPANEIQDIVFFFATCFCKCCS